MSNCSDFPSSEDMKALKLNSDFETEFVESSNNTAVTPQGQTRLTVTGIANKATGLKKGNYLDNPILEDNLEYAYFVATQVKYKIAPGVSAPYQVDSATYPDPETDPNLIAFDYVTDDSLGNLTNYQAASVADMVQGKVVGGKTVGIYVGQVWDTPGTEWRIQGTAVFTYGGYVDLGNSMGAFPTDGVSVLSYGADKTGQVDATQAFNDAADMWGGWVTYTDPELLSTASNPGGRIKVPEGKYLITSDLPMRSGLHWDMNESSIINFLPSTSKSCFAVRKSELEVAYNAGATNWISMTCNKCLISGGVIVGNLSENGSATANIAIQMRNTRWCSVNGTSIQRVYRGVDLGPMNTNDFAGGHVGNFYENSFYGVNITDCFSHFYNEANVTVWSGGTIGQIINLTTKPDHFVENKGAGITFTGCNIAPINPSRSANRALIYDETKGSTYGGGYTEYPGTLFELNPAARYGGFTFTGNHNFLLPQDKLIRFTEGVLPYYDYASNSQYDPDLNGPTNWNQLINSGISIGSPEFIGDAMLLPHYDFKYGLYGVVKGLTGQAEYDIKRFDERQGGFITRFGIRFVPLDSKTQLLLPIKNPRMGMNVCIWYRDIKGNFDSSVGFKIARTNETSIAQDYIDFGNGYRCAVIRIATGDPSAKLNVEIGVNVGEQIEIDNISCYDKGLPVFPSTGQYTPKADKVRGFCNVDTTGFYGQSTGGIFTAGDELDPSIVLNGSGEYSSHSEHEIITSQSAPISYGGMGSAYENIAPIAINLTAGNTKFGIPGSHGKVAGVGVPLWIGTSGDGAVYHAVRRDFVSGEFNNMITLSSPVTGTASLDQKLLPAVTSSKA